MPENTPTGSPLRTLTARAVLVTCLVALVSVLVSGLAGLPLAVRTANNAVRTDLAERADLAAGMVEQRPRRAGKELVAGKLRKQGTDLFLIAGGQPDQPGLPAWVVAQVAAGQQVSGMARVNGSLMLVEGRALTPGNGVVLTQRPTTGVGLAALGRLWFAL
ncbi:MAG TPA: two-component sensor histidine kinase, partial [Rugosimonospora sp.]|nr:two-component sensor histidine kinase [Rugosimonospora sp.]